MGGFSFVVILICIAFLAVTCFLGLNVKRRIVKYIPAMFAGLVSLYFFIVMEKHGVGFAALGYAVLLAISLICMVLSGIAALVLEFIRRKKA